MAKLDPGKTFEMVLKYLLFQDYLQIRRKEVLHM